MATKKQYGDASFYEKKLEKVMERLGVTEFDFNWDRHGSWVDFRYRGESYRFDHTLEKAKAKGIELRFGSDAFAQIVLALEDLARMVERGIYDLSTWVAGMKSLPPAQEIPSFLKFMGFDRIPQIEEVKERYRQLSKQMHPDNGGSKEDFNLLTESRDRAIKYLEKG